MLSLSLLYTADMKRGKRDVGGKLTTTQGYSGGVNILVLKEHVQCKHLRDVKMLTSESTITGVLYKSVLRAIILQ